MKINQYLKAVVAIIGAGLIAVRPLLAHGHLTSSDWLAVAIAVVAAIGVYLVPNQPPAPPAAPAPPTPLPNKQ